MDFQETKLITVTRQDISAGYQLVQSVHACADFIFEHFETASKWKFDSNSIITLATKDETSLLKLYESLKAKGATVTAFYEPDIDNQMTAISLMGTPEFRKYLSYLPLALKEKNNVQLKTA
ncbi:MAG: hypothetical protein HC836_41850 [Richelia sp. RM2_1_2]|nr:hypothetical protein [Richelia sp. RM2_1_2]